jgi:hypothetical protein
MKIELISTHDNHFLAAFKLKSGKRDSGAELKLWLANENWRWVACRRVIKNNDARDLYPFVSSLTLHHVKLKEGSKPNVNQSRASNR